MVSIAAHGFRLKRPYTAVTRPAPRGRRKIRTAEERMPTIVPVSPAANPETAMTAERTAPGTSTRASAMPATMRNVLRHDACPFFVFVRMYCMLFSV